MSSRKNGTEDEDSLFLERVLDSLYDFGSKPKRKCQKNKKRKRSEEEEELPPETSTCRDEDGEGGVHVETEHKGPTGQQVEVVTFQDPSKKPNQTISNKMPAPQTSDQKQNSHGKHGLEKARLEVHRFGITGYKKEQQRVFEQDRAVMLGAWPPKKDYINYKALQQQLKEKKQKEKEEFQPDKKKKKKKSNQRDRKTPSSSGLGSGSTLGQVGRFKNGVLVLSSKEIHKIKGKKK